MSHVVAILLTLIVTTLAICAAEDEIRKDYAKAGYIVIDKQAYRITPVQ